MKGDFIFNRQVVTLKETMEQHLSFYKIQSNNLNLNYANNLTNQTDFCLTKLYFSPLIQTKIEWINKQLLVDVNWLSKAIWKSGLNKAIKDVLLFEKLFKKMDRHMK